jgi:hypothetical protein
VTISDVQRGFLSGLDDVLVAKLAETRFLGDATFLASYSGRIHG